MPPWRATAAEAAHADAARHERDPFGTLPGASDMHATMSDDQTDRITLTIPADGRFRAVSTLVLGGLGSRLDLPYERMDDLQLAILSLLDAVDGDEATVDVAAGDGELAITVGPLRAGSSDDPALERVVSRLVDGVDSALQDGAEWITVRLERPPGTQ
jgi:hypothetical protein